MHMSVRSRLDRFGPIRIDGFLPYPESLEGQVRAARLGLPFSVTFDVIDVRLLGKTHLRLRSPGLHFARLGLR